MKLRWDAGTLQTLELMHAISFKSDQAAARGLAFRIAEVTGRLLTLPVSGQPGIGKGMWLLSVPGSPYVFVYRVEGETVDILSMICIDDRTNMWKQGEEV
jgi:hypothetical protein